MESLPDEILVQIAETVPQCDLLRLTRVSRRLNRCTASLLYRFLVFPHYYVKDLSSLPGLSPALAWAAHPHRMTKIYKLYLLLRTINCSSPLKSRILGISLNTEWVNPEIIHELVQLAQILRPHLQVAHFRLRKFQENLPSLAPFVSLSFPMPSFSATTYSNSSIFARNSLLSLWSLVFNHPSVRCLSVSDIESLNDILEPLGVPNRAGTSNITSLSLPHWEMRGTKVGTLKKILSWPIALQRFHISFVAEMSLDMFYTKYIIRALATQRTSLTALSIDFLNSKSQSQLEHSLGLEKFPILKTLGLPYHELASCHPCLKRKWHILPPSLEVLQLQYEPTMETDSPPSSPERESPMPLVVGSDFVGRMLELLGHIKAECPRLRKIVIWYSMSGRIKKRYYPDEIERDGLVTAFEKAGVMLHGWVQMDPPPFDPI